MCIVSLTEGVAAHFLLDSLYSSLDIVISTDTLECYCIPLQELNVYPIATDFGSGYNVLALRKVLLFDSLSAT